MSLWLLLPVAQLQGWEWTRVEGQLGKQCLNLLVSLVRLPRLCKTDTVHLLTPIADPDTKPASSSMQARFLQFSISKNSAAEEIISWIGSLCPAVQYCPGWLWPKLVSVAAGKCLRACVMTVCLFPLLQLDTEIVLLIRLFFSGWLETRSFNCHCVRRLHTASTQGHDAFDSSKLLFEFLFFQTFLLKLHIPSRAQIVDKSILSLERASRPGGERVP